MAFYEGTCKAKLGQNKLPTFVADLAQSSGYQFYLDYNIISLQLIPNHFKQFSSLRYLSIPVYPFNLVSDDHGDTTKGKSSFQMVRVVIRNDDLDNI